MVIADSFKNPCDVVFVVEGTANLGGYIDVLKENYIVPTLEVFNGGPPDPTDYGNDYSCTLYNMVTFYAADIMPDPAARCSDVTTNIHEFLTWLDNVPFIGGGGETCSHIAEGLSTALHVFDDLTQLRKSVGPPVTKHCILVCNSPPYQLPSQESPRYLGMTCDQLASMMAQRRINLSIISPRKIAALQKLYDESTNQDLPASNNNFTVDPRHHILLHGYQLEERSISPSVEPKSEKDQRPEPSPSPSFAIPSAPASRSYSPSTMVFSPADLNQSQDSQFKVPISTSSHNMVPFTSSIQTSQISNNPPINQSPISSQYNSQQPIPNFGQQSAMQGQQQLQQQQQQQQQQGQQLSHQQQQNQQQQMSLQQQQQQQQCQMFGPPGQGLQPQQQNPQSFNSQFMDPAMSQQTQIHPMSTSVHVSMPTSMIMSHPGMPGLAQRSQNEFNRSNPAIRMPTSTIQQNISSSQSNMPLMSSQVQPGPQMSGIAGIDTSGLPNIPNPVQQQNRDRKIIWSGMLEYQEKIKAPGAAQPKMSRQLQCQLSINATDPDFNTANWPKELIMQLIPQSLLSSPQLQPLFKSSRQVAFHFGNHNVESLKNLHRTMGSGFAGCVHFPPGSQCEVRVLLLLFSNKRKAFIGLIPNDQKAFVDGIRNVIFSHKMKQAQQAQGAGSPQQFGATGMNMGQTVSNPGQPMQQPLGNNTMVSTGMVSQPSNPMMPNAANNMTALQQQQSMQQKIQQAKLQQEQQKQHQLLDEIYFGSPSFFSAQQRLQHHQRLQLQQQQQQQQQPQVNQQVNNHQLQQLLLNQQQQAQQGQQIRQPQMQMIQQQMRGPNPQAQQPMMGGNQGMMPNTMPQMQQQGQVIGQGQPSILDDFNFSDLM